MRASTTTPVATLSETPKCYRPIASSLELDLALICPARMTSEPAPFCELK